MSVLNAKRRNALRDIVFGLPEERKYPMENASHAINAKARAKQQLNRGNLSSSQYSQIVSKANRKLGE